MTQEEKWNLRFQEVKDFIETNHRNPSKHRIEEHNMLSWVKQQRKLINAGKLKPERIEMFNMLSWCKQQRKLLNAGKLKPERIEMFNKLTELWEENKRVNQYQ